MKKNNLQIAIILFKDAPDILPTFMDTETNSGYNKNRPGSCPHYQLKVMIYEIKYMDIV